MARLTRTQKYAELRDQLENGREIEIKSDALNKFEDKLEQLNIDSVNVKEEITEAPKEESPELPLEEANTEADENMMTEEEVTEETAPELTEEVDQEVPASEEMEEVNDDYVPFDFDEPVSDTEEVEEVVAEENPGEEPVSEETSKEETTAEETPVVTETSESEEVPSESDTDNDEPIDLLSSLLNDFDEVKPIVETPETVTEETETVLDTPEETAQEVITSEETEEIVNDEPVDLLDSLLSDLDTVTPVVQDEAEVSETLDVQDTPAETVIQDVEEETPALEEITEPVSEPVVSKEDAEVIDNQYLEECLNEVNEYNKSKGLMTADEVPSTILNEIRGINTQEMPVVNEEVEDELSNTVTLEIKKILSELEAEDNKEEFVHEVEAQMPPTVEEELPKEVSDMLKSYMNNEENKTSSDLEETMLVENMSDIKEEIKAVKDNAANEATLDSTLLNETMPLEVAGNTAAVRENHEDEDDEDEERGPNRILNFILISLIVVLLLILGFIGYLILVAQGII